MQCCNDAWAFLIALFDQPLTLCFMLLITAVLCGVGSAAGLPRLFWHEHRIPALLAGLATTLFFAEGLLVTYLLEGERRFPHEPGFARFSAYAAAFWLLMLMLGLGVGRQVIGPPGIKGKTFHAKRIGPALRVNARTALVRPSVPLWPLPLGAALGAGLLFLGWRALLRIPSFDWLGPLVPDKPAWIPLQAHAAAFFSFVAFGLVFLFLPRRATGAVAICVLLGLVVGGLGFVSFQAHTKAAGPVVLFALLWIGGVRMRKLRIPALEDLYAKPVCYPPRAKNHSASPASPPLLAYDAPLWAAHQGKPGPLIVVCSSGGGIRAATWTAAILGKLDQLPGFRASTRLMAGASGGMVGTAFWMAQPEADKRRGWDSLMSCVAMDSLTPVARQLVFRDVPWAFLPLNNRRDRGRAMEETWIKNARDRLAGARLDQPLSRFRDREAGGEFPSAVFSPMLVEDGRRLIFSNLELRPVTDNQVRWLSSAGSTEADQGLASQSAYHLAELMPDHWPGFPLATAARLSAAFSYVSPAVLLPTQPRRRVVDAGYYDNYGLSLACAWLRTLLVEHGPAMKEHVSSILVIQIRDNVSQLSVNPDDRLDPKRPRPSESTNCLSRGLEGLTTPPEALLSARDSVMLFRNDADLQATSQLYREVFQRDVVNTTAFEFGGEASLSWYLADDEIAIIRQQAESEGIAGKLVAIEEWLERG